LTGKRRCTETEEERRELKYHRGSSGILRRMAHLVFCLMVLLPLAAQATAPPADSAALEILPSGHIAVQVMVNGKGPFRMVLDTGSPVTFLNGRAAQKSGLIGAAEVKQQVLMGMRGQFVLKSLQIGGLKAKDVGVLVMDHPTVEMLSEFEGPLDGILGFSFFARYRTIIDYADKWVSFEPVSYLPADIITAVTGRLMGGPERRVVAPSGLWGLVVDKPDAASGVRITQVFPQSAAEAAGLKVGDRLLTLDSRWTDTLIDCYEAASLAPAGQEIMVRVLRDGKELEVPVRPHVGF
jgi:membrane-associated protease RseP (regulator of RpoE activity)